MFTKKEINKIEDYIYGHMDAQSAADFVDEMVNNVTLLQEVFVRQVINETTDEQHLISLLEEANADKGMKGFLHNIQAIDQAFHINVHQLLEENPPTSAQETETYTLDDLLAMFQPAREYEEVLLSAARAANMEVIQPVNGQNCKGQIQFLLKEALSADFKVRIENNQMEAILTQRFQASQTEFTIDLPSNLFQASQTEFTIDLPSNLFQPGRYYWKLWNKSGLVMGMFFVGKELMGTIKK